MQRGGPLGLVRRVAVAGENGSGEGRGGRVHSRVGLPGSVRVGAARNLRITPQDHESW